MVLPSGIVSTAWPSVRDKCYELGISFQRWQDGAGRCILAKREDGLYAAGIGGVVISIPRQVGKTFLIGAIVFALCLLHPGILVLWTAHRVRTAGETFRSMQGMARRKLIKPFVEHVRRGSGEQAIEFRNGSRIMFGARETGFGRGIPGVSIVVFDEGQILTTDAQDDMIPATNQAENPLIIYTGTPPKPTDPGEVFTRLRAKALNGESENVLYLEFSADESCDPTKWAKGFVDWLQVGKANPSFPKWTPRAAILRMLEQLGLGSFMLEGLGIWPKADVTKATISAARWKSLATATPPADGRVSLGVKFSLDGSRVALAAVRKSADGPLFAEVLAVRPMSDGLGWLVDVIGPSWRKFAAIVIDGKAGAGDLRQKLLNAGVSALVLPTLTTDQVISAHSMTLSAVTDSTLTHGNQAGLNASVAAATQRKIGLMGGWGWAPIADGDVVPIEAVTFALYGATTSTTDNWITTAPRRLY